MVAGSVLAGIAAKSLLIKSVLDRGNGASHVLLAEAICELCSLKRFHLLNHILIHTLCVKFGLVAFFVILNRNRAKLIKSISERP